MVREPTPGRAAVISHVLISTSLVPTKFAPPHLNMFVSKKVFYECSINSSHACMMNSKAIGQQILQFQVL